ncbi:hypothetical protein A3K24_01535 [candidate division Kazan bacterium RIFCSPHIGHO2_01_FULL_44_14]|uniref:Four helix bundle protein n=1 Tax=candidate division Kazan bacterium RIFCSPLOWO2_01_FULL_45_19 TaxID=1798538 RepID=A0A1F4NQG5_UNCK3|nr:hypothetical protein [uncultured bacterium]OGB73518.1 MAG: hypothetical protein A3K51_01535 [candidate division Kazan bacterium RIFCSPLOWO2_01_FULL_45_19]OGB77763.1 MAG: hypothetical protein A3K24_01535 [candidate division Kazan bacterium RIFCSPHIGHO2_01_FULL_44_14]
MNGGYAQLSVWQKARILATSIYRHTQHFPIDERFGLQSQIRRSAVSIASNIAEGCGRSSAKDFIRFIRIARGSLAELETQTHIASDLQYLTSEQVTDIIRQSEEINRMLAGLIKSQKNNISNQITVND